MLFSLRSSFPEISSGTCLIVACVIGCTWCTLLDDFEALRLEKKPFEASRACLGPPLGEDGKGGSEVKSGEFGSFPAGGNWAGAGSNFRTLIGTPSRDEGELLPASVGDVMSLLIADVLFGTVKESEDGLAISVRCHGPAIAYRDVDLTLRFWLMNTWDKPDPELRLCLVPGSFTKSRPNDDWLFPSYRADSGRIRPPGIQPALV